jgi:O-antigen ligase
VPIALNEFINDQHLSMSLHDSDMTMKMGKNTLEERRFASVTFGNLNAYNVILCMTFCIMLIQSLREKRIERLISYGMVVCLIAMIAENSSRASLICIATAFVMYALVLLKKRSHIIILLGGVAIIFGLYIYRFAELFSMIWTRFQVQGLEDVGRMSVIVYGLEEFHQSYGLGIGIGNFIPTMLTKYHLDIAAPHNLLLEVGVQFGVIVLALFIGIFIRIFKRAKAGTIFNRSAALLGIIPFIPASIIDSGYIAKVPTWFYIATIYILSMPEYNDSEI